MDNKGDVKGANAENGAFFGPQEMLPNSPDNANFDAFVNSREDLKPQMEMPAELIDNDNSAEVSGEMQSNAQPAPAAPPVQDVAVDENEQKNQQVKAQLGEIKVKRDAESLPKAYEKAVKSIVERNKKDPFRLVQEMDIARWDLMEKAFARKMGDGLNGTGAK